MEPLLGVLGIIVVFVFIYVAAGIKIVQPYERGVIEELGKYKQTVDPGLRFILPFVQVMRRVDMREQVIDVPPQEVITQDNVSVAVDAVIYFEATDPQRLLYNVSNFVLAVTKLAQTNLRNVIGEMSLDEAFVSRERVNGALRQILDDATDKWGVRVVRVEIQRIEPPADVMSAMHEQMKAERTRRAVVTAAEGTREAAVTRAEGEKQAAILTAEGEKQRDILTAEGEAEATRTRADAERFRLEVEAAGESNAISSVFGAIRSSGTDDRVIAIKYLEALQGIANGRATKIFVPADMSAALGAIGGIADLVSNPDGGTDDAGPPAPPPRIVGGRASTPSSAESEARQRARERAAAIMEESQIEVSDIDPGIAEPAQIQVPEPPQVRATQPPTNPMQPPQPPPPSSGPIR